jgi:hypothetical protein
MIIYTAMPLEMVYEGFMDHKPEFQEVEYLGVHMIVEPAENQKAKIVRLLSPNPQDYLNPQLQPGNTIYIR